MPLAYTRSSYGGGFNVGLKLNAKSIGSQKSNSVLVVQERAGQKQGLKKKLPRVRN